MNYILYAVFGIVGGILGGMGMGGGTVLIPLLTLFLSVSQYGAQTLNLISFIPMSMIALAIHFKNGLVEVKRGVLLIISGIFGCVLGAFIARFTGGEVLRKCFGAFLIIVSVFQITENLIKTRKKPAND